MSYHDASLVQRLCEVKSPLDLDDWKGRDSYYVAACRISADDVPRLLHLARRWLDSDWPRDVDGLDIDSDQAQLLPVTAWRTLADLKADTAVEPLVDMLRELDDEHDNRVAEELPYVFGKIGESAVEALTQLAKDTRVADFIRSIAVRGLRQVADYHADTRDRIVTCLTEMMASAQDGEVDFNTTLLVELVELRAVEAAEPIERAFAGNVLDVGMIGDWEDVRRKLGVEGLGLTMPENPHNSVERLRIRLGIGVFSNRPIFTTYGEIDQDAERAYYERAHDTFSRSPEAQRVIERFGDLGWSRMLLEFGLDYLGKIVDEMTIASVREFVLRHVPHQVSTEQDAAESIVCELAMFWEYLDRVYELPEAKSIVDWLKTRGLVAQLEAELADTSNYGMAKSLFMLGKNAGYDMTSEAGLAEFMTAYTRSELSKESPPPASTAAQGHRVGRNDPCPCGSGKKFKKCCR